MYNGHGKTSSKRVQKLPFLYHETSMHEKKKYCACVNRFLLTFMTQLLFHTLSTTLVNFLHTFKHSSVLFALSLKTLKRRNFRAFEEVYRTHFNRYTKFTTIARSPFIRTSITKNNTLFSNKLTKITIS